jgi:hypothetical protein
VGSSVGTIDLSTTGSEGATDNDSSDSKEDSAGEQPGDEVKRGDNRDGEQGARTKRSRLVVGSPEEERENPYVMSPSLGGRCSYCAESGHVRRDEKGNLLCTTEKKADRMSGCIYGTCPTKGEHRTRACPELHSLCPSCLHRGHTRKTKCQDWTKARWEEARIEFEETADDGYWTSKRRADERYGFWGAMRGSAFPYPCGYKTLTTMVVANVDVLLADQRKGVRVSAPGRGAESSGTGGEGGRKRATPSTTTEKGKSATGKGKRSRGAAADARRQGGAPGTDQSSRSGVKTKGQIKK